MSKSHHSPNEVRRFPTKRYAERRKWLDSVKVLAGCADCGLSGPAEALTFDHVRGEKRFDIGQSWNQGRTRLEEEIAKCEIVCANCHNIRTKRRARATDDVPEFKPFTKIPRLYREIIITEKIDGTNAVVWVDGDGDVLAGSRKRWLTESDDNAGFAAWVSAHAPEFAELGPTVLRGEWYGRGIQRNYRLTDRRFAVFNSDIDIPACCERVPVLYRGVYSDFAIETALDRLRLCGSQAAPGFMDPEGIVMYHTASGQLFKVTLKGDEVPKGKAATTVKENEA